MYINLNKLKDFFVCRNDIQDNLISTDTNKPLSANQGKVIKDTIDSKVDKTGGASQITDSNASEYTYISSSLTSSSTQANINSAINTKLDDISDTIGNAITYINQ